MILWRIGRLSRLFRSRRFLRLMMLRRGLRLLGGFTSHFTRDVGGWS